MFLSPYKECDLLLVDFQRHSSEALTVVVSVVWELCWEDSGLHIERLLFEVACKNQMLTDSYPISYLSS